MGGDKESGNLLQAIMLACCESLRHQCTQQSSLGIVRFLVPLLRVHDLLVASIP
jgi:hypothetical protein